MLRAYRACVRHIYASETRLDSLQLKQQRIFFITPLVKAVSFLGPFALNNGIYVIRTFHFWRKYFDLSRKKIIPVISIRRYDASTSGPLVYKGGFSSLLILYTRLSIMRALVTHFSSVSSWNPKVLFGSIDFQLNIEECLSEYTAFQPSTTEILK